MKKVGYVTVGSATDTREWSGLNAHILQALSQGGLEMVVADQLDPGELLWPRFKARCFGRLSGRSYPLDREWSVARRWAAAAARRLRAQGAVETVISPGTIPIALLPDDYQTVIWADATFHSLRSTYPGFARISRHSIDSGDRLEQLAYDRSSLVCFSSEWAAADAAHYYGVSRSKIAVIPFGANCPEIFADLDSATTAIEARPRTQCRLVFMGVDWERKGGPLVLEIAAQLHKMGIPVHLTVVGCTPPNVSLPIYVNCAGFLNKHDPATWRRWHAVMMSAHFMIVPSMAECYGLVYAESSAYAVPSVARDVGGVSSVVRDGINGFLFASDDAPAVFAEAMAELWSDPCTYQRLALASFRESRANLNWRTAGARFVERFSALDARERTARREESPDSRSVAQSTT